MILHGHWKSRDQLDGSSLPPEKRNPKISRMGVKMGRNREGNRGVQRNGVVLVLVAVVAAVVVAFCH